MSTEERFDQLEGVMVESLRKQDLTIEEVAHLREEVSELNTKIVRLENRLVRVENRLGALENRMDVLENRMAALENNMAALESRMARLEGKMEDYGRNLLELRRDTEKYQQETTAGISHIIDLIKGLK